LVQDALLKIKNKLIVSCQSEGDSPFNNPEGVANFAIAAKMGGAGGIRSEGIEKTKLIRKLIDLPLIGLIKDKFPDNFVRITRTFKEVEGILNTGIDIIAIDGTSRIVNGYSGPEFISACKKQYPEICVLADISTLYDADESIAHGADAVSTCLRGYTPDTTALINGKVDVCFIKTLIAKHPGFPVLAEGLINSPDEAGEISEIGVWAVVVGTAITRPQIVTEWYVKAFKW
jgi:N-acylglucosamine-6-phosphate 2-epimerase